MKILFISHDSSLYGASRSLVNLIEGLQKLGVSCYVVSHNEGPLLNTLKEKDIPYSRILFNWWISGLSENPGWSKPLAAIRYYKKHILFQLFNVRQVSSFDKVISGFRPDFLVTNTSVTPIGALVAMRYKLPHIWYIREFLSLDFGSKVSFGNKLFSYLLRKSEAQIFVSQALQNYWQSKVKVTKGFVIYNGVIFKKDQSSRKIDRKPGSGFTFLILGRFGKAKGQTLALEAFELLIKRQPDIRLILAGDGFPEPLKARYSARYGEKIVFHDFVKDTSGLYSEADCVLVCSENEAFGRVAVEAMSYGLPVIGYDNAGTKEIIEHNRNGLLFKNGKNELAECMETLALDPEKAIELGKNGCAEVMKRFTIEDYAAQFLNVLKMLKKGEKASDNIL